MTASSFQPLPTGIAPDAGVGVSEHRDVQRQSLKRLRATLLPFAVGMVGAIFAAVAGLAEPWQAAVLVAYTASGLAIFFWLLHSGVASRSRDPMLTYPQVLFGIGLVALSYAVMDVARTVALQWLCLIIVFDMRRLPKRETWVAAALAIALPVLGVVIAWRLQPGRIKLGDELIFLGLGGVMVPVLLVVSAAARRLRSRRRQQHEQMAQALEQMRVLAIRDGLTGLYNRRYMLDCLEEEVRRQQRTGRPFCVAILDIDLFKHVNDQLGHAMGDTVLRHFAALGQAAFHGRTDVLARWGGEEFLLLMPETTQAQAHAALARMRALVHSYDWTQHDARLAVRFSSGVCEHGKGHSLTQTLELADQALYRAKHGGRDRIEPASLMSDADLASSAAAANSDLPSLAAVAQFVAAASAAPYATTESAVKSKPKGGAAAAGRSKGSTAGQSRWSKLLLSSDPSRHEALRLCLVVSGIYATVVLAIVFYGLPSGMIRPHLGAILLAIQFIGATVPYTLVRTGISARWKDSALVVPQMLWAITSLIVFSVLLPEGRTYDMQVLCVVLVFGFIDMRPRQAMVVGVTAVVMLALAYGGSLALMPPKFLPLTTGLQMAMTAYIAMLLTLQSRNFALARDRSRQEKRELAATTERIEHLMTHDALTGLFNRQHIQGMLERECERHMRSNHAFCVALIDLDHFKKINDSHGHQVGDEALTGFARTAQGLLRETDAIGRWGGEEFLVLLTETEPGSQGMLAVERLRERVAAQRLCAGAPDLQLTFSAGVAERRPGETLVHLLERVDRGLYAAKAQGRNRCVLAD